MILLFSIIGIGIGIVYTLLFVQFDDTWKRIIETIGGVAGSAGIISLLFNTFNIEEKSDRMWSALVLIAGIVITFIVGLFIICRLIKDKDDKDVLRIRDIILGQKEYIKEYYKKRSKEIDQKLNIEQLKKREEEVSKREVECSAFEKRIKEENEKLKRLGNKRLKVTIPQNKIVHLDQRIINESPSYINDYAYTIAGINQIVDETISQRKIRDEISFKSFVLKILTILRQYMFGDSDLRIHFRYHDSNTKMYELLIGIDGPGKMVSELTSIPYKNSMIEESFRCKCGIIKSYN